MPLLCSWRQHFFHDSIPALLEAGADPNNLISGRTPPLKSIIVYAATPTIVIRTLLDGGADINKDAGGGKRA